MNKLLGVFLLFVLSGCASNQPKLADEVKRFRSLDKQHFVNTISIKDDQFENVAIVTTQNGFIQKWPWGNRFQNDAFLRGFINKKTRVKTYQVYVHLRHFTGNWLFPYQVNYGRPLRESDALRISSDVNCNRGSCRYDEHVAFEVEESELRRMETLTPEDIATKSWVFKIKNKSGEDVMDGFNVNEILAFLEVMDSYEPISPLE